MSFFMSALEQHVDIPVKVLNEFNTLMLHCDIIFWHSHGNFQIKVDLKEYGSTPRPNRIPKANFAVD